MTKARAVDGASAVGLLESTLYMRNQLLRDSDWASMAHSLELRTPLVDVTLLAKLAPYVPAFTGGVGKTILAQAPDQPLPKSIINRPKTGFELPMDKWLTQAMDHSAGADFRQFIGVAVTLGSALGDARNRSVRVMSRPRILIPIRHYEPAFRHGGAIRSVTNLVAALHEEFEFKIICLGRDFGETSRLDGIEEDVWLSRNGAQVLYLSCGVMDALQAHQNNPGN